MTKRTIITTEEEARQLIRDKIGYDFAWDVETTGLSYEKDRLLGLALTFDKDQSYYITLEHTIDGEWEGGAGERRPSHVFLPSATFRSIVSPLFNQRDPLMVAHNAKFDLHFMNRIGVEVLGGLADTMLASKLLDENRKGGLKELGKLVGMNLVPYLELEHYPGFKREEYLGVPREIASNYAMLDTEATLALWKKFSVELVEEGLQDVYQRVWIPMLIVLQQMEAKGIALDLNKVREVRKEYEAKASAAEWRVWEQGIQMVLERYPRGTARPKFYERTLSDDELDHIIETDDGEQWIEERGVRLPVYLPTPRAKKLRTLDFNPGSSGQLGELIFDYMNLRPPDGWRLNRKADGSYSSDKSTLKIIDMALAEDSPPMIQDVLDYRKSTKFIGTYLDRFLESSDPEDHNCIRTTFNQDVADTGRLSSSSPNLQNIPSRGEVGAQARSMFVARPGMKLIVADYSMMELRMVAHYSQDETMMKAFRDGMDLHALTASQNMGISYEEIQELLAAGDKEAKQQRSVGKTENFGLLYGMKAPKFRTQLRVETGILIDLEESERVVNGFDELYTGVAVWRGRVVRWTHRHGYVKTIYGRKRRVPDIWSDDKWRVMRAERQAVNAIIQGSCSDIICEAIPAIQQALKPLGGHVLLQVHDEVVCEIPEEHAEAGRLIVEKMLTTFVNPKLRVPLSVDAHLGDTWADAKG